MSPTPRDSSGNPLRPLLLAQKTSLITGGATGIGRAIAKAYIHHGARVAVNFYPDEKSREHFRTLREECRGEIVDYYGRREVEGERGGERDGRGEGEEEKLVDEWLIAVEGDVTLPETGKEIVSKTVEKWGRLDVFVSNAGICVFEEFFDVTPDLLTRHITTNLTSSFYATQAAAHQMAFAQQPAGGSILALSSISALVGGATQTHYTPTKAGVLSLMQSTACSLGKHNIRCNAILPGTIRTQLNERELEGEYGSYMEKRVPLGRVGVPEDVGGVAVFLGCGELSGYVSGGQVLVDGGLFVNLQ